MNINEQAKQEAIKKFQSLTLTPKQKKDVEYGVSKIIRPKEVKSFQVNCKTGDSYHGKINGLSFSCNGDRHDLRFIIDYDTQKYYNETKEAHYVFLVCAMAEGHVLNHNKEFFVDCK